MLQGLIREVTDERGIPISPEARHAVAVEVLRRVPQQHSGLVAVKTMAMFVQWTINGWGARLRPVPPPRDPTPAASSAEETDTGTGADFEAEIAPPVLLPVVGSTPSGVPAPPRPGNANSANCATDAVMRRIGRLLRDTIYPAVVRDKSLGDFTLDEVDALAAYLDDKAAQYTEKALEYRKLASHMVALNAKTVHDLPLDLLDEIFCSRVPA